MSWRMFAFIANFAPIFGFIHIYFVPESPAWLVMKGKIKSANKSLIKLRGIDYPHDIELDYLKQSNLYSKMDQIQAVIFFRDLMILMYGNHS